MKIIHTMAKAILLVSIVSLLAMPAVAGDKLQVGASKGEAKKHKKSYKTPCTGNCEDKSTRNLKNR